MANLLQILLLSLLKLRCFELACGWIVKRSTAVCIGRHFQSSSSRHRHEVVFSSSSLSMRNVFQDLGDMMTGGKLIPQTILPYGQPLEGMTSSVTTRTLAVAERPLSFTGEDFDVVDVTSPTGNKPYCRVRGALLHLPGKDKMRLFNSENNNLMCELDRKLVALTPTYDIFRSDGGSSTLSKIGWIEKAVVALTDTFEVHLEGEGRKGGMGPFKPPAAYRLEGDFLDRNFRMTNDKGEVVAKVAKKDAWIILPQFDSFNHYQIQIAPGMDAGLVVACACVIDEEFDQEHKAKRRKEEEQQGGNGWFG